MKCITLFLVLSLVVLMAEPGEGFIHHIFKGIANVGRMIHGIVTRRRGMREQQELDRQEQAAFTRLHESVRVHLKEPLKAMFKMKRNAFFVVLTFLILY
ncbi:dicentracin-like isoform X2 [Micropterus salmoides]|uniref:dicentracin-like isoform X2 n=1 Tax=Micropterus salmoides TaxID=27706 RepID=UPI0018EC5172|nr:dicentracin-like isoform X2 [Micropterus salmoides]